jgi:hypothetical protein
MAERTRSRSSLGYGEGILPVDQSNGSHATENWG